MRIDAMDLYYGNLSLALLAHDTPSSQEANGCWDLLLKAPSSRRQDSLD